VSPSPLGPVWAVVVAAGSGERLGAGRPKAYVRFGGRTLLAASLLALEEHEAVDGVIVVVPDGWEERTSLLADDLCATKIAAAVPGGAARADSVAAGLAEVPDAAGVVMVHDAARPLVSEDLVDRVLGRLLDGGDDGVVPGLPVTDTVKRVDGRGRVQDTVARDGLWTVQTPQAFRAGVLRRAYDGDRDDATDCASLVERAGGRVVVVEGDPENLKVTSRSDLERAEVLYTALHPPPDLSDLMAGADDDEDEEDAS
jgi:2-C-methyl-D-erythritol 4-phosphate cytidylyltransferase